MSDAEFRDRDTAVERARREVYLEQRELGDLADTLGIAAIAIGISVVLWGYIPHTRLLVWGALLFVGAIGWFSSVVPPGTDGLRARLVRGLWIWGSSILWGALPWLSLSAVKDDTVAWVLVFVVVYGVASDIVFVPQTFATSIDWIVYGYSGSYVVAFTIAGQYEAAGAAAAAVFLLLFGARGWRVLLETLIDRRVEMERRSMIDELTGVGNRAAAVEAIYEMRVNATDEVHCLFCDVDDFKQLNDTYGYDAGDLALQAIAAHLSRHMASDWHVARFGGDEFVAVGPSVPDLSQLFDIEVPLPADYDGTSISLQLSIGATVLPREEATPGRLFREAGAAVRAAKGVGKHVAVHMTTGLRESEAERTALASEVSQALEADEIIAHAQAINDLRTGEIVGIELLARWPRADGTTTMPNDFVPVIEEQGRGPQLGRLMIGRAVEILGELKSAGCDIYVSVNISARHLFHRRLPQEIAEQLAASDVAEGRLVLEITESQHLPSSPIWHTTADQLRALGVGLAIDDFGTGYSSMEQLLSMPFSHLKVDRIVTASHSRPGGAELAAAICAMAQGAGMTAIAEGIESESERNQMLESGYAYGQGYLFSRPAPLDDFLDLIHPRDHGSRVV